MGSINVDEKIDISRIQKLAGIMNASTAAGTPVVSEAVDGNISLEEAEELADQLEEQLEIMGNAMSQMESIIRSQLPQEYRNMEAYTFAHIKTSLGGYGYHDRMTRTVSDLIEDLRNGYTDEE